MTVDTLHDKFVHHLQEAYYVENRLVDVIDEMRADVENDDLREGFEEHLEETREHVARLEDVFDAIDQVPEERECPTFDALLEERRVLLERGGGDSDMRDLHNLGIALKNEHMEIASYETLVMLARKLDLSRDVRDRLDDNLDEEQETKKQLKTMADDSTVRKIFARLAG